MSSVFLRERSRKSTGSHVTFRRPIPVSLLYNYELLYVWIPIHVHMFYPPARFILHLYLKKKHLGSGIMGGVLILGAENAYELHVRSWQAGPG